MSEQWFYYTFRCKVRPNSLYGKLCRFLKADEPDFEEPEFTETEMVLEAGSAYNLPLVFKRLREVGKCSEGELKHCGRVAIFKLIQRAYFFAQVCGLEEELNLIPVLGSSNQQRYINPSHVSNGTNELTRQVATMPNELGVEQSTNEPLEPLLHHQDDDAVFGTLFRQE